PALVLAAGGGAGNSAVTSRVVPLRMATIGSGEVAEARSRSKPSTSTTGSPLTREMTSPGRIPARSAGLAVVTPRTSTPWPGFEPTAAARSRLRFSQRTPSPAAPLLRTSAIGACAVSGGATAAAVAGTGTGTGSPIGVPVEPAKGVGSGPAEEELAPAAAAMPTAAPVAAAEPAPSAVVPTVPL